MEIWKENRIVYDGKIVRVRTGNAELDDGRLAFREVVEHPGGVCVVPFTGHSVILIRQYRIALGQYIIEAPAGKLEAGDSPLFRGESELEEEIGYRAGTMLPAGRVFSSVGFCSEIIHLYLGLDLDKTQQRLEEDERIELVEFSLAEVREGLRAHRFEDAKTVAGLYALLDYLGEGNRE